MDQFQFDKDPAARGAENADRGNECIIDRGPR